MRKPTAWADRVEPYRLKPASRGPVSRLYADNPIAAARLDLGWRQWDLAERIGVGRHTIRRLEAGDPTVQLSVRLAAMYVLGFPVPVCVQPVDNRTPSEGAFFQAGVVAPPERLTCETGAV